MKCLHKAVFPNLLFNGVTHKKIFNIPRNAYILNMLTGQKKLIAEKFYVPLVKQLCHTKILVTWKK
jgi:hypothetical protein